MRITLKLTVLIICLVLTAGVAVSVAGSDKVKAQKDGYALFKQKCLGCHASVADPERQGKTKDSWHVIIKVMHKYGVGITEDEQDTLIEYMYKIRQGIERDAG